MCNHCKRDASLSGLELNCCLISPSFSVTLQLACEQAHVLGLCASNESYKIITVPARITCEPVELSYRLSRDSRRLHLGPNSVCNHTGAFLTNHSHNNLLVRYFLPVNLVILYFCYFHGRKHKGSKRLLTISLSR